MMLDFVFPIFSESYDLTFCDLLAREVRRLGFRPGFLVTTRRVEAELKKNHPDVFFVYEGFDRSAKPSADAIWEVERKYKLTSLRSLVYPESVYDWGTPTERIVPRALHVFGFLEQFLEAHPVRWFVNNVGAEAVRRVVCRVAEHRGIGNAVFDFAAIHGRFVFAAGEMGLKLPPIPDHIPAADIDEGKRLLARMTRERKPFAPVSALGFGAANFRGAIVAASRMFDQPDVSLSHLTRERLRRLARRAAGSVLYESPPPNEKYVFFPLHLFNDSALTVRSPQYQRQEDFVAYLSERALPSGMKLYVKPHIGARDAYTIDMLARIRRMPDVRLVAPTINPHDIIEGSEMVVVINSTAGFEAILHQKPTVVLGRPFYRGHGLTVDVDNPGELAAYVERALSFRPSIEQTIRFLAHYRNHTHEGVYGDHSAENVSRMAKCLVELDQQQAAASQSVSGGASPRRTT